jgi:hypothetical protein
MKIRKLRYCFIGDDQAVLGLPMRLTVSLVIGTVALIAILSFILNPCLFPGRMIVSVTPLVNVIDGGESENLSFTVYVNGTKGHPVSGASVIIKGLGGAGSGFTDNGGKTIIQLQVQLQQGVYEGYLDVSVKAPCYSPFEHQDMVKVVKSGL